LEQLINGLRNKAIKQRVFKIGDSLDWSKASEPAVSLNHYAEFNIHNASTNGAASTG
jgi:hypothetical protein